MLRDYAFSVSQEVRPFSFAQPQMGIHYSTMKMQELGMELFDMENDAKQYIISRITLKML